MELLIQVLLCLVFVLSLALYFQLGRELQQPSGGSGSGKSSSSKSKSKKKSKRAGGPAQAPVAQPAEAKSADSPPKEVGEHKARDVPAPPAASVSDEMVPLRNQTRDTSKLADTGDDGLRSLGPGKDSAVSTTTSPRQTPEAEDGTVDPASFRDQSDRSRIRPEEDAWQSVGKGAARLNKPMQNSSTSYSSIASSNPFAVLPGDGTKAASAVSRSISIPASTKSTSSKARPPTTSQTATAAAAELTKRQRQNAARAAAAKQAKDEEEKIRLARLEGHRREAQRERMREEERKKFAKGIHTSGPNGATANGNSTATRGNRAFKADYPICIHCSRPAHAIYKHYTENLVVLLPCSGPSCGGLIDSYAEEEYRDSGNSRVTTSWVDLILVKPRAYRHFLYNTRFLLPKSQNPHNKLKKGSQAGLADYVEDQKHPNRQAWLTVAKRFTALSLVDAYLRWFYLCAYGKSSFTDASTRAHASLPRHSLPRLLVALLDVVARRRRSGRPEVTHAMGASYFLVWASTFAETLALYGTVSLFSAIYVKSVRLMRQTSYENNCGHDTLHSDDSTEDLSDEGEGAEEALEDASAFVLSSSSDGLPEEPERGIASPAAEVLEGVDMIDLYRAHLVPTALLLSSLSTLILLSIVLLWESKLPRPSSISPISEVATVVGSSSSHLLPTWLLPSARASQIVDEVVVLVGSTFSTDFAVRTLLGGLSAGVSLAVIHPRSPLLTTSLLLLGWLAASLVRSHFTLLPSPDAGPGTSAVQAGIGQGFVWQDIRGARSVYCAAPA